MAGTIVQSLIYLLIICAAWIVIVFPPGVSGTLLGLYLGDSLEIISHTVTRLAALSTVLLVTHFYVRRTLGTGLTELGLAFTRRMALLFGTGTLIGTAGLGSVFLISFFLGYLAVESYAWSTGAPAQFLTGIYHALLLCAVVAVTEEVIFRGYLLQSLNRVFSRIPAIIVTSLLFALPHLGMSIASSAHPMMLFAGLFAAGAILASAYYLSRSLWLPIGIHFSWNLAGILLGWSGRTPETTVLLATRLEGPAWLAGSAYGAEGALFGYVGMSIMGVLLYLFRSKLRPPAVFTRFYS